MSNSNPLIPQGSLLEQQAKGRPHLRIALCIVAVHVIFLGGLLMQGCKREDQPETSGLMTELPPLDLTNLYPSLLDAGTNEVTAPASSNQTEPFRLPGDSFTNVGLLPTLTPDGIPAPAGVEAPLIAPATQDYVVVKDDSFYSIGRKFGVSSSAIAKANPGVDSTRLQIGQTLKIPSPVSAATAGSTAEVYVVKAGDTLTAIAGRHGTTVAALKELNGLKTDRINVGQRLKLPTAAPPSPPTGPGTF